LPQRCGARVLAQFTRYGVYLLLVVYTFGFLDRQVINILVEPIKRDLGLIRFAGDHTQIIRRSLTQVRTYSSFDHTARF
jgi:hypothetical protein